MWRTPRRAVGAARRLQPCERFGLLNSGKGVEKTGVSKATIECLRPGLYKSWFRKNGVKNSQILQPGKNAKTVGLYRTWMQKGLFAMGPKSDPNARSVRRKLLERHAFVMLTSACVSTQAVSRIASICAPPLRQKADDAASMPHLFTI